MAAIRQGVNDFSRQIEYKPDLPSDSLFVKMLAQLAKYSATIG